MMLNCLTFKSLIFVYFLRENLIPKRWLKNSILCMEMFSSFFYCRWFFLKKIYYFFHKNVGFRVGWCQRYSGQTSDISATRETSACNNQGKPITLIVLIFLSYIPWRFCSLSVPFLHGAIFQSKQIDVAFWLLI